MSGCARAMATIAAACAAGLLISCEGTTSKGYDYTMKVDRELQTFFARDSEVVFQASLDIVQNHFKYRVVKQVRDHEEGLIEARTAKEDVVRVETYRDSDFMTRIEVFVGPMGEETLERAILDAIAQRLRSGRG